MSNAKTFIGTVLKDLLMNRLQDSIKDHELNRQKFIQ